MCPPVSVQATAPLILCAGIAVLDHVYRLERFPGPGTKTRARDFLVVVGGCAANAAVAIARLGGRARLAAPLGGPAGADAVGDAIVAGLEREGVDAAGVVRTPGVISPTSAIMIDASGERLIVNQRDEALTAVRAADAEQARRGRACDARRQPLCANSCCRSRRPRAAAACRWCSTATGRRARAMRC